LWVCVLGVGELGRDRTVEKKTKETRKRGKGVKPRPARDGAVSFAAASFLFVASFSKPVRGRLSFPFCPCVCVCGRSVVPAPPRPPPPFISCDAISTCARIEKRVSREKKAAMAETSAHYQRPLCVCVCCFFRWIYAPIPPIRSLRVAGVDALSSPSPLSLPLPTRPCFFKGRRAARGPIGQVRVVLLPLPSNTHRLYGPFSCGGGRVVLCHR
jgi:hypothetical protein